jgi:hypothetical protein
LQLSDVLIGNSGSVNVVWVNRRNHVVLASDPADDHEAMKLCMLADLGMATDMNRHPDLPK